MKAAESFEGFHDEKTVCRRLAEAGFTALVVEPKDVSAICAAREALAYRSGMADAVLAVLGLGCHPVNAAGGADKQRWLGPVAAGEQACGFALTEPEAGSDVAALATTARRDGDGWILDGKKTFISNAPIASWFALFARTEAGPTAFVVERGDPGVKVLEDVPLSVAHPIGSVVLEGARLPAGRLLGAEGQGIKLALATLDTFRTTVAAAACGMAHRALDEAIARVKARRQFGKALAEFQMTQARLADCATELAAARALVERACREPSKLNVAIAKLFATEAAQRIVDAAVQLHGGLGVVKGVVVEELYREVRALRIYEGTSEIQKLIIAREILR
jgi:acyl-CoA dehydrogenase